MDHENLCSEFIRLIEIVARLRGPDGCPWDRQQDYYTLKSCIVEEAYEVVETLIEQDTGALKEELGDLLLQVVFQAQIGREKQDFDLVEVISLIADKLIRRHPHVFGDVEVNSVTDVKENWDDIKNREQEQDGVQGSLLDSFHRGQPPLNQAYELQELAAKVGFDWDDTSDVQAKVEEELDELKQAIAVRDQYKIEDEFGDSLFALVNLARFIDVDPGIALLGTINKFRRRFKYMEEAAAERGNIIKELSLLEMEELWEESKEMEE